MKILSKNILIPVTKCWLRSTQRSYGIGGSEDPPCTAPCTPESLKHDPNYPQPRVIIIGAGMAGLSAAVRLTQRGINNYLILEAYERPGGRIRSFFLGDAVAELGAAYDFPYRSNHPVFKLSAEEDPPRPGVPGATHPRGLFNRVAPGKMDCRAVTTAYYKFRQIEQEAASIYCMGGSKQHGSLVNFISLRIQQELHEFPEDQQHDAARIMFGLSHMLTARSERDNAMLSSDNVGYYQSMQGSQVRVPLGTVGALSPLLRIIPEGRLRYCKPVNCVYWGTTQKQGHRAIVYTADGEEFPCDYVISTVSVGVLLSTCGRLFCPELPLTKMSAMSNIRIGVIDKIYCEYCRPFWYWHNGNINFKNCGGKAGYDWTRGITSIEKVRNSNSVICVQVVGEAARAMEGLDDRDVADGITSALRNLTGNMCIPYPMNIIRSFWGKDPYFLGSFCCEQIESCGQTQRVLSCPVPGPGEPCPPIILSAGEATVPYYCGTIAAARLSGIREAERIVQMTLQFQGGPLRDLTREEANMKTQNVRASN